MAATIQFATEADIPELLQLRLSVDADQGSAFRQRPLEHNDQRQERRAMAEIVSSTDRAAAWADHWHTEDGDQEAVGN
jgi:hypothetical protein